MAPRRLTLACALAVLAGAAAADEIGRVGIDWTGNDIVLEAVADPKVQGVTCHLAYFDRSILDRVSQGNWFEDPSNSSIACRQTGPIVLGDIARGPKGEEVFREGRSLIFKSLRVTRVYDEKNNVLVYLAHAREISQGSAKMAISTVPLWQAGADGAPVTPGN
jgi:CreA protein